MAEDLGLSEGEDIYWIPDVYTDQEGYFEVTDQYAVLEYVLAKTSTYGY